MKGACDLCECINLGGGDKKGIRSLGLKLQWKGAACDTGRRWDVVTKDVQ
jgi:hypothetical protein